MKKNLLTLLLVCVMALSFSLVAFAADNVDGATAVKDVKAGKAYIIDVRSNKVHTANNMDHIEGVYHIPVFDDDNKTDTEAALALHDAFVTKVTELKDTLSQKPIYLLCNSGARGAVKGTELLKAATYDESKIHTITNGAKDMEIRYAMLNVNNSITNDLAVSGETSIVLDVRNNANYNKANLKDSIHIPVFTEEGKPAGTADEDIAKSFVAAVTDNAALKDKDIYILCNSGARGARAATVLLKDAGYDVNKIYTITGGAAGIPSLEFRYGMLGVNNAIAGNKALANSDAVIIDVRNEANYNKGHLENALHIPVFTEEGKPAGTADEDIAKSFVAAVTDNAALKDKEIYLLCNSGARGARAATVLLKDAGYDVNKIYTITNGAKDLEIRYAMLGVNNAVTGEQALANSNAVIIDVRNDENYNKGHLEGALHIPVFTAEGTPAGTADEEIAKAFVAAVTDNAALKDKEIYLLCNSGQRGARAATVLLKDAGYDVSKIYTITGGAKDQAIIDAFKGETTPSKPSSPVTGETLSTGYILLMLALVVAFVSKKKFA